MGGSRVDTWRALAGAIALICAFIGTLGNALQAFGIDGWLLHDIRYGVAVVFAPAFVAWLVLGLRQRRHRRRDRVARASHTAEPSGARRN
jgi:hypothetical protein